MSITEKLKRNIFMNNKITIFLTVLAIFLLSSILDTEDNKINEQSDNGSKNAPAYQINTISAGDKFSYKVKWAGVTVASSELMVIETTGIQNQLTYHVMNHVWTEGVLAVFFKVDSTVESFIDAINLYSWRYVKNIREGRYRDNLVVDFDQINHIAKRQDTTFTIPENVQDPLSILWYFRNLNIKEENIMSFYYCDGKRNEIIQIQVLKKEKVSTPAGEFMTDVIEFSAGGKDRNYLKKDVRLKVWFSDDEMRMPVFIQAKAPVGIITGTLVNTNFKSRNIEEKK
ncbi:MAG: DUF3108 domain-containing protein [bacterium]|nr:DUF3108 domain-containing protein [bacterium]